MQPLFFIEVRIVAAFVDTFSSYGAFIVVRPCLAISARTPVMRSSRANPVAKRAFGEPRTAQGIPSPRFRNAGPTHGHFRLNGGPLSGPP